MGVSRGIFCVLTARTLAKKSTSSVSILPHLSHEIQKSWIIEILSLASSHDYDIVDSNKRAAREGIISDSSSDAIAARGQIAQTTLGC